MKVKRLINFGERDLEWLKAAALRSESSVSAVVREAVAEKRAREERRAAPARGRR